MKRGVVLAAVLAVFLAAYAPAEAAIIKKWSAEVSAQGGYTKIDKDAAWSDTSISGARIGLSVLPALQVEVSLDSFTTDPDDPDVPDADISSDYTGLRFIGSFFAEEDVNVMPFLAAGIGTVETEREPADGSLTEKDEGTYGELGFGARIFVWRNLNIRTELGFRHMRTLDVTQTNVHLTLSASYFFGGVE